VKILILHQHFKIPQRGGAIRSYYLAKALVDRGVQVVVITAHNEAGHRKDSVEGIEVHYLPVAYDNRFTFFRRIFAFYRFARKAAALATNHRDASLCYTISTPLTTGVAAMWIARKFKIPYVFEVGDLWPDAPIAMGFVRGRLLQRALYALERRIYRKALSVVALSPPIAEAVRAKCPGKPVHLIPNMADTAFYKPEKKDPAHDEQFQTKGKFVVSYIGAVGFANGLDYFLDCAAASQRHGLRVQFLLCGDGARLEAVKGHARELQLTNLIFVPFQNRDGVCAVMNVTDANFISYRPERILETGSPNKYFDGLAAGKLTVINFGGWIKEEIEKEECGIYTDPGSAADFVKKIQPFINDQMLLQAYQQRGRALAERKYSREMLSEKFVRLLKS